MGDAVEQRHPHSPVAERDHGGDAAVHVPEEPGGVGRPRRQPLGRRSRGLRPHEPQRPRAERRQHRHDELHESHAPVPLRELPVEQHALPHFGVGIAEIRQCREHGRPRARVPRDRLEDRIGDLHPDAHAVLGERPGHDEREGPEDRDQEPTPGDRREYGPGGQVAQHGGPVETEADDGEQHPAAEQLECVVAVPDELDQGRHHQTRSHDQQRETTDVPDRRFGPSRRGREADPIPGTFDHAAHVSPTSVRRGRVNQRQNPAIVMSTG